MAKKRLKLAYLFVLPVLLVRLLTTLYPIVTAAWYSLLDYDLINQRKEWFGLGNYQKLWGEPVFVDSIQFTLIYTFASVGGFIVLGILLALLLKIDFHGRKLVRTVSLIPWAMPTIIVAIAASWAFNDTYGIVNDLVRRTANPNFHMMWLNESFLARVTVIVVNLWKNTPFFAIIMLAAFQGIPMELYESATIDGAGHVRTFFSITMPGSLKTLINITMFNIIWSLNGFDIVYALTKGGPGTSTSLLAYAVYREAFRNLNYGSASAITLVMAAMASVFAVLGMKAQSRIDF